MSDLLSCAIGMSVDVSSRFSSWGFAPFATSPVVSNVQNGQAPKRAVCIFHVRRLFDQRVWYCPQHAPAAARWRKPLLHLTPGDQMVRRAICVSLQHIVLCLALSGCRQEIVIITDSTITHRCIHEPRRETAGTKRCDS